MRWFLLLCVFAVGVLFGYEYAKSTIKPPPQVVTMILNPDGGKFYVSPSRGNTIQWLQRGQPAITPVFNHNISPCVSGNTDPCVVSDSAAGVYKYKCTNPVCPDPGVDMGSGIGGMGGDDAGGKIEPQPARADAAKHPVSIYCGDNGLKGDPEPVSGLVVNDTISFEAEGIGDLAWQVTVNQGVCTNGTVFGYMSPMCILNAAPPQQYTATSGKACGADPTKNTFTGHLRP